jgi:hypothetical protein
MLDTDHLSMDILGDFGFWVSMSLQRLQIVYNVIYCYFIRRGYKGYAWPKIVELIAGSHTLPIKIQTQAIR